MRQLGLLEAVPNTCPICRGDGWTQAEARIIKVRMIRFTETCCRCCKGRGTATAEQVTLYHRNRRDDATRERAARP